VFTQSLVRQQVEQEVGALFDFMQHIYGLFGFEFHLELSTRPEKFLGEIETWDDAEEVRHSSRTRLLRSLMHNFSNSNNR
jgi:threonyl-tRNA synthetase